MTMTYPFRRYNYRVAIDGKVVGGFSEISAPDISVGPIEYREGKFPGNTVGKQPGLVKYGNLTLKWGVTESMELYNWIKEIEGGTVNRKNVVISLHDGNYQELAKWTIISAWPTKYTASDFNPSNNEVAIESLELAHEGITREI